MKCRSAAAAVTLLLVASACDRRPEPARPAPSVEAQAPTAPASVDVAPRPAPTVTPAVIPSGAPAFAQVFPGATVEGEPLSASGAAGPGGLVTFTTEAQPDAIITFYRSRAEAAGLAKVMDLNQGKSRAYGALDQTSGAEVQVVATAVEDAPTSVQLTWSAGQ